MNQAKFDADVVIDARDCILGRVASQVAQRALDGERVAVVNAERAVITGREEQVMEKFRKRRDLGSDRGPYYPKRPDRIFKRSIRGMLPHKKQRGRDAFERVRVYVGDPFDDADPVVLDGTSLDRLSNIKFVQLGDISEQLGANVTW
ncbi:50S ribosomal protein L13 [Salinarchaeum sp. IM2453]|uniref:50S ribosomal protein L13 n=1 Tax=Salinarchaeum sp. IM2453 TaxID=2862870 RepID=UPI001C8315D4|nr:50S ribosomal protein L13 [Salinarchaeum sp. IM2453]QZA87802.1 50S ribosomal protein L13 [Salinarchaeum sp. IM2453]